MTSIRRSTASAVVTSRAGGYDRAWIVLGGEGWKLRSFYTGGGLEPQLVQARLVRTVTRETFVAAANRGEL